jgi:hypothetical protein
MTIQELTTQLASDPSNWESRLALVQALVAEGRHDSAVEAVNQGEALPHEAGAWLAAARTYAAVGAIEQARGLVASALEIDPDYAPARDYQAELEASLAPAPVSLSADDLDEEEVTVVAAAAPAIPIVRITGDKTPIALPKVAFASHEIDALREAEEEAERRRQAVIRRDKFNSLTITVLIHVAIFFALTLVATQVPPRVPPQIVASASPPRPEETIENVTLDKPSLDPTTAVNTAVADIISVNATSNFSVSSVEVAISDVAVETGMEFSPSMSLGMPTSTESKMMFGQPMEGAGEVLGVILDVSGSMAEFLPAVVREVDKNFKDSPVVYARSMLFRKDRRDSEVRLIIPEEVVQFFPDIKPQTRTPYAFLWDDLPRKAPQRYVDRLIETFKTRPNQFLMVGREWDQNSTDAAIEFLLEQKVDSLYIFSDFEDFVDEDVAVELGQKLGRRKIRTFLQPAEKGSEFLDVMTKKIANKTLGRQLPSLVSLLRGSEEAEVTSLMPKQREAEVSKLAGLNIKLATPRPTLPDPPKDRTIIHKLSEPEYDAIFYGPQARVEVFLKTPEGYIQNPIVFSYWSRKEIPDHPDPRYRERARQFLRLAEEPSFDGKEIVWKMILEDEIKFDVHLYLGRKGMNATFVAEPPKDGTNDDPRINFHIPALASESNDLFRGPDFPASGVKLDIVREATKENEVIINLPREEMDRYGNDWIQTNFEPGYNTIKYNELVRRFPQGIRDIVVQGPSFGPRKIHARTTSGKVLLYAGAYRNDTEPWEGFHATLRRLGDTRTRFTKTEAIELEIE